MDLLRAVEVARADKSLITSYCAACGRCCRYEHLPVFGLDILETKNRLGEEVWRNYVTLPEQPSPAERREAILEFVQNHDLDHATATLLYEYNVAEPVSYAKSSDGGCVYLTNGLCSNYPDRAFTCALYACTTGERLSNLQELIVRQGVWHSYYVLGWIEAEDIEHNPFLSAETYESVRIADFDVDLSAALETLFFFF